MSGSNAGAGALRQVGLENSYTRKRVPSPSSPTATRNQGFLSSALIEENASDRGKRAARAGLAFTLQAAVIGLLLLVPLLFTEGIDPYKFDNTVLIAPLPPAAPPPPAMHVQSIPKQAFMHAQLTAPTMIPKRIAESAPDAGAAPVISDLVRGVPGGTGDVLGGSITGPAPPPPGPIEKPKGPIRIYSGMKEPTLVYNPPLAYPPIAKQAHVSGTVVIEAVIDDKGTVTQVHVVSGPALLLESALNAVSAQRYQPTILDGQPVSIRYDVKVVFRLG